MSLSSKVQTFLETEQLHYDLAHASASGNPGEQIANPSAMATLIVLEDEQGKTQVLIPRASLLDLTALNHRYGRNWHASKNPTAVPDDAEGHPSSALPFLTDTALLVDQHLLKLDPIYLESGSADIFIKLSQTEFSRLINNAPTEPLCQPLKPLIRASLTEENDLSHITQSIETFSTRRIKSRLNETLEIPPLPISVEKIIQLRINPNAHVEELVSIINTDPSLAAQIVSWAASPFYSVPGKIRSVEDAIIRVLGFELVINLAIGLAIGKTLKLPHDHPHNQATYWEEALLSATVMERLSRLHPSLNRPARGLSYLAGLLHNFGFIVLGHAFPPHFSLLCRHLEANPHVPSAYIDQHLFGMTRDQISSILFQNWSLPEEIVRAVRWQHIPSYQGPYANYANLLCLSHHLINTIRGHQNCLMTPTQTTQLYERLNIEPEAAQILVAEIMNKQEQFKTASTFFK
ncbi:MAG TPA: HDOD domain-containing protein [Pseudomonadales bacterium]|nr:HDOD domain-containing protein [Pseudomonadales bacterium]